MSRYRVSVHAESAALLCLLDHLPHAPCLVAVTGPSSTAQLGEKIAMPNTLAATFNCLSKQKNCIWPAVALSTVDAAANRHVETREDSELMDQRYRSDRPIAKFG